VILDPAGKASNGVHATLQEISLSCCAQAQHPAGIFRWCSQAKPFPAKPSQREVLIWMLRLRAA
jgi:hypothetical protein